MLQRLPTQPRLGFHVDQLLNMITSHVSHPDTANLTSQLPVASWHAQIGDPTIADSILDRLVHNAHRIELQGESMRKRHGQKGGKENV